MPVLGEKELESLVAVEEEIIAMMVALNHRNILLDRRTPLLTAAQAHYQFVTEYAEQHSWTDPAKDPTRDPDFERRLQEAESSEAQRIEEKKRRKAMYLAELEKRIASDMLNAAKLNNSALSGLDSSSSTAIESVETALNAFTTSALDPRKEDEFNILSQRTTKLEESVLNLSTMTAIEPEENEEPNIPVATAFDREEENKASISVATAIEGSLGAVDKSMANMEVAEVNAMKENEEKDNSFQNYRHWVKQLRTLRQTSMDDHTPMLKQMLREMKTAWF